ncbi:MAG: DNA-binding response regulator [Bradyrhizobium sp.]|nr:DNA-binding response regulator [Bradyrhizobium sp.]
MSRILIAEDDKSLGRALAKLLHDDGYAIDLFEDAESAFQVVHEEPYAAVVLDIGLPGMSGLEFLTAIRRRGIRTPVLLLTARQAIEDRVRGLDQGADDYLTKPFDAAELLARLRALIRRGAGDPSPQIVVGELTCDLAAGTASVRGKTLDLRKREWSVLVILAGRAGKVIPKERILSEVFGFDESVGPNTVEVYITRLRKKLGEEGPTIRSLRGLGYMMETR